MSIFVEDTDKIVLLTYFWLTLLKGVKSKKTVIMSKLWKSITKVSFLLRQRLIMTSFPGRSGGSAPRGCYFNSSSPAHVIFLSLPRGGWGWHCTFGRNELYLWYLKRQQDDTMHFHASFSLWGRYTPHGCHHWPPQVTVTDSCQVRWPTYAVIGWLTKTRTAALLWLVVQRHPTVLCSTPKNRSRWIQLVLHLRWYGVHRFTSVDSTVSIFNASVVYLTPSGLQRGWPLNPLPIRLFTDNSSHSG